MEQGQNEQNIPALGSGWPLSEISYKTEGGLLLAHTTNNDGFHLWIINNLSLHLLSKN